MLKGVLAAAVSWVLMLPSLHAAELPQFEVLRLNGELVRWFPRENGKFIVSYAVADREIVTPGAVNCTAVRAPRTMIAAAGIDDARLRAIIERAFATWAHVADISFVAAANAADADVIIGEQVHPVGRAFANIVPGPARAGGFRQISKGAICFNPERAWKDGFDGDKSVYDISFTLTHEIGHILGLDHPSRRGQLMSFRYDETVSGLTVGDIAGAWFMYGKRETIAIPANAAR